MDTQEEVIVALTEYVLLVHERDALRDSIKAMEVHYSALCHAVVDAWIDYIQANEVWEQSKQ